MSSRAAGRDLYVATSYKVQHTMPIWTEIPPIVGMTSTHEHRPHKKNTKAHVSQQETQGRMSSRAAGRDLYVATSHKVQHTTPIWTEIPPNVGMTSLLKHWMLQGWENLEPYISTLMPVNLPLIFH